jgi:cyclase
MPQIALAPLLVLLLATAAVAAPPDPEVVPLSARVFALVGPEELPNRDNRGFVGNSVLIVGDQGAILVDSGFTHELGLHLRRAVARITPKPVTHVINTHAHGDHFLGNSAFPEAIIISSERCRDAVAREGRAAVALIERLTGLPATGTTPVPATQTYPERSRTPVTLNGVRMTLWVPPGSHTPGDLLVHLPDEGVLIAGDVLSNGAVPNLRDGDTEAWLATLELAQQLPFTSAMPGHGRPMSRGDVAAFTRRLADLHAAIEKGYRQGLTDSEIRGRLDLTEWRRMKRFDEMGLNINHIYVEVEKKNF